MESAPDAAWLEELLGSDGVVSPPLKRKARETEPAPPTARPVLAYEYYLAAHAELERDAALRAWNDLSLAERAPFFDQAAAAAAAHQQAPRRNASAYQHFIAAESRAALDAHPVLSLPQVTRDVLAPRWRAMSAAERAPYEAEAAHDASRYQASKQEQLSDRAADWAAATNVQRAVATEPLSALGLYMAASWDSLVDHERADDAREAAIRARWLDLPEADKRPWLERAAQNQKAFVLTALGRNTGRRSRREK